MPRTARPGDPPTGRCPVAGCSGDAVARMLTRFFFTLREAGVPVSVTEYLTLLEALEARVAEYSVDDFYFLARATLVKDEKHFDRFDRAFAAHFKGIEQAFEGCSAGAARRTGCKQADRAALHRRGEGADRGARRLGQADGDARSSGSRSRRAGTRAAASGSAPAAPRRSATAATTPKASASAAQGGNRTRGEGLGEARVPQPRRHRRTRHAQHQGGAAQAAPLRARGRGRRVRPRRHDLLRPRATPACST